MEILITAIVIIIFGFILYINRKEGIAEVDEKVAKNLEEKKSWSQKKFMSYDEVQKAKLELYQVIDTKFVGEKEMANFFKEIVEEWADLKVKTFKERRSWVRKPEKKEE